MQSASDRDKFVEIVWDKIQKDKKNNFVLFGYEKITHFGVPYDYDSVMHYPRVAFSVDGSETIVPIKVGFSVEVSMNYLNLRIPE
jgi:hypothetical protein